MTNAVGRFAPSPSGRMHLGNAASAVLAYASIRKQGGSFLLRIEDLDRARCKSSYVDALIDDLRWLGLDWDGEVLYQSRRNAIYEAQLARLGQSNHIYPCFCTRADLHAASAPHAADGQLRYGGACKVLSAKEVAEKRRDREPALRVEVPDREVAFCDIVHGMQTENLALSCGDFVVKRADGLFAYQLAVVVDDGLSGVTEVVRGGDLLSSTARQIWLHEQLGFAVPSFAHVPLLCAADGRRLSKREQDLDIHYLRQKLTQEALLGMLAGLFGIQPDGSPCSMQKFISMFSWEMISKENIILPPDFLSKVIT